MTHRTVVRNIGQLLTMDSRPAPDSQAPDVLGLIEWAALVIEGDRILWAGAEADLPEPFLADAESLDAGGRVVMPGLVECHTHLVFGGMRAQEFELRARGASYEEIAAAGGGIANTVRATREAGADELFVAGMLRLDEFVKMGVTTVEAKSGYGLETQAELKILEVTRSLDGRHPVDIVSTFLGAHIVPPEHKAQRESYVEQVCAEMIPEVAQRDLARFCDVFCETGAFTVGESRRILQAGLDHGLAPKIHAEQLSHSGACRLAAELEAASADHLDFATPEDAQALAAAGVTAVLLPGATFFIGKKRYPDGRALVQAGAEVALSTDYNPGSSHTQNLWLMGTMGCTYCGLTPSQALRAMTTGAARALQLGDVVGTLRPGLQADFLVLDRADWQEILYLYGHNPVAEVYKRGQRIWPRV